MLCLAAFWVFDAFKSSKKSGLGERGGEEQREGENKRNVGANPRHCEKVMCFDMSN